MKKRSRGRRPRFWITAGLSILLGGMMMLGFSGCGKASYAVDYRGQKEEYRDARDTYRAGENVRLLYFMVGTDTDYSFYLDGEPLNPHYEEGEGFVLEFTMPDHDVQLECRAVCSMVRSAVGDANAVAGDMLMDYYTASVATVGGDGHLEMVLNAYTTNQLKLIVYRKDSPDSAEISTTYIVPFAALNRCFEVIDRENMRTWNEEYMSDGAEGAETVCKFRDTDGSYVRVSSDAMPSDGSQVFSRIRDVLQSYATDTYRQ